MSSTVPYAPKWDPEGDSKSLPGREFWMSERDIDWAKHAAGDRAFSAKLPSLEACRGAACTLCAKEYGTDGMIPTFIYRGDGHWEFEVGRKWYYVHVMDEPAIFHPGMAFPASDMAAPGQGLEYLGTFYGMDVYINTRSFYMYCVYGPGQGEYYSGVIHWFNLSRVPQSFEKHTVPTYFMAAACAIMRHPRYLPHVIREVER